MTDWWFWSLFAIILLFGFVVLRGAPYVPSHRRFAKIAFEKLYPLRLDDVVVDLGSGDGIILRLVAERAERAIGYELNPVLVLISRLLAKGNPKIETRLADFWLVDLPADTTVVYAFSVSRDMAKLERKMQQTADRNGRGVRLITYGAKLKSKLPTATEQAHSLYLFEPEPLQRH